MKKTGILIDSTITLDDEYIKENNIYVVPLYLVFEENSIREEGDMIQLTSDIMEKIKINKKIPKTSQPSTQDFLNTYEQMVEAGYEKIFSFHLSSKISGTMQGSKSAAETIMEKYNDVEINVFDTLLTSYAASYIVIDIINQIKLGQDLNEKEVQKIIDYYVENSKVIFCVDNLDFLAYGGRISSKMASVGNLFGIKPMLSLEKGSIVEFDKVRSKKKVYQRILEELKKEQIKGKDIQYSITHVLNEENANDLADILERELGNKVDVITYFSAVIATHTGPGTIFLVYVPKRINH